MCGDGYVQPSNDDEECERGAFSPGWKNHGELWGPQWTCNIEHCSRLNYTTCATDDAHLKTKAEVLEVSKEPNVGFSQQ